MRPSNFLAVLVGLAASFLIGAYAEFAAGVPFGGRSGDPPLPNRAANTAGVRTDVPIVSHVQGAQDAARADVPMGAEIDMQRCVATMLARKVTESDAHTVCTKLIAGISH